MSLMPGRRWGAQPGSEALLKRLRAFVGGCLPA